MVLVPQKIFLLFLAELIFFSEFSEKNNFGEKPALRTNGQ